MQKLVPGSCVDTLPAAFPVLTLQNTVEKEEKAKKRPCPMLLNALELPLQFHLSLREMDPSFQYHQKWELTLSELDCTSCSKEMDSQNKRQELQTFI